MPLYVGILLLGLVSIFERDAWAPFIASKEKYELLFFICLPLF